MHRNILKITIKSIYFMALFLSLFSPHIAFSALDYNGLVQCDGVKSIEYDENGRSIGITPGEENRQEECDFAALMAMINRIIRWVFGLTIPLFIGMCAYAGILYMQPNPAKRSEANKMLSAGVKGFIIMLVAWFIVTTLVGWIVATNYKGSATSLLDQKK